MGILKEGLDMNHKPNLLLVEDDVAFRTLAKKRIASALGNSAHLESSDSLTQAKKKCQATQFDLILLDLNLTDSHGIHTYFEMIDACPKATIIVLTGSKDPVVMEQLHRISEKNYYLKSEVSIKSLTGIILNLLGKDKITQTQKPSDKKDTPKPEVIEIKTEGDNYFNYIFQEIKNPLLAVEDLLNKIKTLNEDPESYQQLQNLIDETLLQTKKSLNMTDTGMSHNLILNDTKQIHIEEHDLNKDIYNLLDHYIKSLKYSKFNFDLNLSSELPLAFYDSFLFQRSFINLLFHVLDQAESKIWIETKAKYVASLKSQTINLKIGHDGSHLSKEAMIRFLSGLNEKSFSKKDIEHGTMLRICKHFINEMNCEFDVESLSNGGIEFNITFPTSHASASISQNQVLIIEDDPYCFELLCKRLKAHNIQCSIATSVEQAQELIEGGKILPKLVLLDLGLAQASGFAFLSYLQQLHKKNEKYRIPVIVLSGYHEKEIVEHAMNMGANAFIAKPYKARDLINTVDSYIHSSTYSQQVT